MKVSNKLYGYPILSKYYDDYLSSFEVLIEKKDDLKNQRIEIKVSIKSQTNQKINEYLKQRKMSYALHLEDSKTLYRETFLFNNDYFRVEIPSEKLRDTLDVNLLLITTGKIVDYTPESTHIFYTNIKYNFDAYQIIGIGQSSTIKVRKEMDEIPDSKSIFSIIPIKDKPNGDIEYEISSDRILIKLPEEDFKTYHILYNQNAIKNRNKYILLSNIITPIMVDFFYSIRGNYQIYEDTIWFISIVEAYNELDISIIDEFKKEKFEGYKLVQILFDSIISKSMNQMNELMNIVRSES